MAKLIKRKSSPSVDTGQKRTPSSRRPRVRFPVVGIGASAGGLEAFAALLKHLPTDTGMAFVLVQHLDPDHDSALAEVLQRATRMPVHVITDHLAPKANHVYVIPPNVTLGLVRRVFILQARESPRVPVRSIDAFFESLAADLRESAIGIVLSGTASDGTAGLEAIKAEGGLTFAQDDSAKYDSMPRSAIAAGCVDFVLSPEAIAGELARIANHPAMSRPQRKGPAEDAAGPAAAAVPNPSADSVRKILQLLRAQSGVDFSLYKPSTITRRIMRRVVLSRQDTLEQYARFVRGNARELDALYADCLISVTHFFRNPEAFEVLQRKVWPGLLQERNHEPVRVWSVGCSTGQEPYSIAMSFVEAAEKSSRSRRIQVFATDLNDGPLDNARQGLYPASLLEHVSAERLRRFFVEEKQGYRVEKSLREMVVFARHNLLADPPFSRMDVVSCRNLLIYFDPGLQKKVFPVFHYALKRGGYLHLGGSESIGPFTELFEPVDKKHKIYRKKPAAPAALHLPAGRERGDQLTGRTRRDERARTPPGAGRQDSPVFAGESNAQREADRVIVNQFGPPGVLIDADCRVLQFRGATDAYLEPPKGKASFDVLKMARHGLMLPLRAAIAKARKEKKPVSQRNVRVEKDGKTRAITLHVIPLMNLHERCFLITFEDAGTARRRRDSTPARVARPRGAQHRHIAELEATVAELRDYLQSIQEQHEASTEELQSSNEEVQSANEELQSLNEELETSKEELESANEELVTFNEEMADRNAELGRLNADLRTAEKAAAAARDHAEAILRTSRDPFLILDPSLRVLQVNDAFLKRFRVDGADVRGRLVYELGQGQWNIPKLRNLLEEVLPRNSFFADFEITADFNNIGRRTLLVNARRLDDGVAGGAILLGIHDVTEILQFQVAARSTQARYSALIEASANVIWTADPHGDVIEDSESWRDFTGQTVQESTGLGWLNAIHPDDRGRVQELWRHTVATRVALFTEYRLRNARGAWRWTEVRAVPVLNADRSVREWVISNVDIHERRELSEALQEADRNKNVFLAMLAHELRNPLAPISHSIEIVRKLLPVALADEGTLESRAAALGAVQTTAAIMDRQVRHMARLIDDLLDVSRISRGRIELHLETVDLSAIVRGAAEGIRPVLDGKLQVLSVRLPATPVWVSGDPHRLTQMIENLLHNATKFTGDGGTIEVTVDVDVHASGGPHASVRIRDSGVGIPAEQLERIFDMFLQLDTSLSRSGGGLGIGLTLVRTLAEMHGGSVQAHSAGVGRGAEFILRLPAIAEEEGG